MNATAPLEDDRSSLAPLAIIAKLWRRPALTEWTAAHVARFAPAGSVFIGIRSPGDPNPTPASPGWGYVAARNYPLSPKGNAGAIAARGVARAVLNLGSDDVCSAGYYAAVLAALEAGAPLVFPRGLVLYDLATNQATAIDAPRVVGAGRTLSADSLDALAWQPWPGSGRSPDSDMDRRLREKAPSAYARVVHVAGADVAGDGPFGPSVVVDFKGRDNIGTYEMVIGRRRREGLPCREVEPESLARALGVSFADLRDLARRGAQDDYPLRASMKPELAEPSPDRPVGVVADRTWRNDALEGVVRRGTVLYLSERRAAALHKVRAVKYLKTDRAVAPADPRPADSPADVPTSGRVLATRRNLGELMSEAAEGPLTPLEEPAGALQADELEADVAVPVTEILPAAEPAQREDDRPSRRKRRPNADAENAAAAAQADKPRRRRRSS